MTFAMGASAIDTTPHRKHIRDARNCAVALSTPIDRAEALLAQQRIGNPNGHLRLAARFPRSKRGIATIRQHLE